MTRLRPARRPIFLLATLSAAALALPRGRTPLPVVHLGIPDSAVTEDGVASAMGVADTGSNGFADSCAAFSAPIRIQRHGHSSDWFAKKSYEIGIRDRSGQEAKASILGMSKESGWMLIAGFTDKSCLRNAFAYAMARASGRYAPRARFVEVVMDTAYQGLYLLVEKVQRSAGRVAVAKLDSADTSGSGLTGGYVLRIDRDDGNGWWSPNVYEVYWQHYYPKDDKILPAQRRYIRGFVDSFEVAMASDTFSRSPGGYRRWIDPGSFQDYLLMQELMKNIDGYRMSAFLTKDRDSAGGRLSAGPIWDMDLTGGLPDYFDGWKTDGWQYLWDAKANDDGNAIPSWWPRLAQERTFRQELGCRWRSLRRGAWSDERWTGLFDSLGAVVSPAQRRNFERWPVLDQQLWPEKYVAGSWAGEVDTLRSWLQARIRWIDAQFPSCTDGATPKERSPGLHSGFVRDRDVLRWEAPPRRVWVSDLAGGMREMPSGPTTVLPAGRGIVAVRWIGQPGTPVRTELLVR